MRQYFNHFVYKNEILSTSYTKENLEAGMDIIVSGEIREIKRIQKYEYPNHEVNFIYLTDLKP